MMLLIKLNSKNKNSVYSLIPCLLPVLLAGCGGGSGQIAGVAGGNNDIQIVAPLAASAVTAVPVAPSGLAITSGSGEVAISWNAVAGASSYNVYFLTYPGVTVTNARQLTNAVSGEPITGLADTVPYYFKVTALNNAGESAASAEISATPMPALPGIPGNVRLAGGLGEATLAWQAVPYATSYNVYYGTAPGLTTASSQSIKGVSRTSQKITGLTSAPGHYYFMVTAVDASGEGQASVELTAVAKSAYKSLAAGFGHSVALRIIEPTLAVNEGTVWEWGDNSSGQLGDGTTSAKLTAKMTPTLSAVTNIASGYHHTIALKTDNSVMDWGLNNRGQLGKVGSVANSNVPLHAFAPYAMTAVAGGYQHTMALKNDGTVWTWGYNLMGALGYATIDCANYIYGATPGYTCNFTPTQVPGITGSATAIAAGFDHTLAVTSDGSVWSWGRNDTGQLGNTTTTCPVDQQVADNFGFTVDTTPSIANSCSTSAVQVAAIPGTVVAVTAGTRHSVALMSDGTVYTWGGNHYGQLGYDATTNCQITSAFKMKCSTTPTLVPGLDHIVAISAGSDHTVALRNDGTVWAWGLNVVGTTNITSTLTETSVLAGVAAKQAPSQVPNLTGITAIAAGTYHSLALKNDGSVWAWGYNGQGQLGNNSRTDSATPVQVQGLLGPVVLIPGI